MVIYQNTETNLTSSFASTNAGDNVQMNLVLYFQAEITVSAQIFC